MKTISRFIMTLALLLTAVGGAWAQEDPEGTPTVSVSDLKYEGGLYFYEVTATAKQAYGMDTEVKYTTDGTTPTSSSPAYTGPIKCYKNQTVKFQALLMGSTIPGAAKDATITFSFEGPTITVDGAKVTISTNLNNATTYYKLNGGDAVEGTEVTLTQSATVTAYVVVTNGTYANFTSSESSKEVTIQDEPDVEVTTNAAQAGDFFTEASFTMPTFDATVNYDIVRDMQDETNPVAFTGLPTTTTAPIVVKKGSDGKYQPIETLTIQLIDPLAAAEAQNIIAADGITVKVLVGAENGQGAIDYDQENPITFEAFLADMKPGYYWIKAESTDENSPYDGTVYSSQFTVVEKYDLTVKPANDFSKGKIESVTVGGGSVTIDANTGEATKTGIAPETEVKVKAKRGYVIDKVEVKKAAPALKTLIVNAKQLNYVEGDTWQQAIERPENAGSGWKVQGNYIFNGGLTLFTKGGGATYVYVKPGDTIDATKNYSLEAD